MKNQLKGLLAVLVLLCSYHLFATYEVSSINAEITVLLDGVEIHVKDKNKTQDLPQMQSVSAKHEKYLVPKNVDIIRGWGKLWFVHLYEEKNEKNTLLASLWKYEGSNWNHIGTRKVESDKVENLTGYAATFASCAGDVIVTLQNTNKAGVTNNVYHVLYPRREDSRWNFSYKKTYDTNDYVYFPEGIWSRIQSKVSSGQKL